VKNNMTQRKWLCCYDSDGIAEPDIIVFDTRKEAMREAVKTLHETEYDDRNPEFPTRETAETSLKRDGGVWLGDCKIAVYSCEYRSEKGKCGVGKK
jgi:hypothetical protein